MQRWGFAIVISIMMASPCVFGGESSFMLLSQEKNGIAYYKDPCQSNAFNIVLSFSQDLEDPREEEIAFIRFSENFEEYLLSSNLDMKDMTLYYSVPKKIGNRHIHVYYVVKQLTYSGYDQGLDLPDQIEIDLIDEDLALIRDKNLRVISALEREQSAVTLINKNANKKCDQ